MFKKVAEARYNEIMHSEDAWEMVDEDNPEDEYKPTKSAAKLTSLLELVTSLYHQIPFSSSNFQSIIFCWDFNIVLSF